MTAIVRHTPESRASVVIEAMHAEGGCGTLMLPFATHHHAEILAAEHGGAPYSWVKAISAVRNALCAVMRDSAQTTLMVLLTHDDGHIRLGAAKTILQYLGPVPPTDAGVNVRFDAEAERWRAASAIAEAEIIEDD